MEIPELKTVLEMTNSLHRTLQEKISMNLKIINYKLKEIIKLRHREGKRVKKKKKNKVLSDM